MNGVTFKSYPVELINGHKVKAVEQFYFGYRQGFKILIDGRKFPTKLGHHYTELDKQQAIINGLNDYAQYHQSLLSIDQQIKTELKNELNFK